MNLNIECMSRLHQPVSIFWFRRDLRLEDNAALYHALRNSKLPILPIFIFDTAILDKLEDQDDARVTFIHDAVSKLKKRLEAVGSSLWTFQGEPVKVWSSLLEHFEISEVFANRDYEPYAVERDAQITALLEQGGLRFSTYKDHVLFEHGEVLKGNGEPYVVFTPYRRAWFSMLESKPNDAHVSYYLKPYPSERYLTSLLKSESKPMSSLAELGFDRSSISVPEATVNERAIRQYEAKRNFPAMEVTSRLGVHFRFGTIGIRQVAAKVFHLSQTFISELIWRDFYAQILAHFPHVVDGSFRSKYDNIEWRNNEDEFKAWCMGKTGYPLVDAGMRELNATGYMHNRVRMVAASFLTKHLLIDWKWGAAYFARRLLDYDLASNNGGWQWAAGSGTDAAPYFRIFNPELQRRKFDREMKYVRKWVPEVETDQYPAPIVAHGYARERCLKTYKEALT